MKLSSRVKKALKAIEAKDDKAWLVAHNEAFTIVIYLLQEEIDKISKDFYKEVDYDSPNWSLLKADQSGQLRILNKLKSLFED
jgi:hypothetical protein